MKENWKEILECLPSLNAWDWVNYQGKGFVLDLSLAGCEGQDWGQASFWLRMRAFYCFFFLSGWEVEVKRVNGRVWEEAASWIPNHLLLWYPTHSSRCSVKGLTLHHQCYSDDQISNTWSLQGKQYSNHSKYDSVNKNFMGNLNCRMERTEERGSDNNGHCQPLTV